MTLVLSLILKSVRADSQTFVDLGIVDFLNSLRNDVSADEKVSIDVILAELDKVNLSNASSLQSAREAEDPPPRSAYFLGLDRPQNTDKYPPWMKVYINAINA